MARGRVDEWLATHWQMLTPTGKRGEQEKRGGGYTRHHRDAPPGSLESGELAEGRDTCYGVAEDEGVDLARALVGKDALQVVPEAHDRVVQRYAVAAEYGARLARDLDRLADVVELAERDLLGPQGALVFHASEVEGEESALLYLGSVRPKQPIASPQAMGGSHTVCCSSVSNLWIALIAREPWTETKVLSPESPASSSMHARPKAPRSCQRTRSLRGAY
jgi:hypothetical protein